jgi:zinc transport system ATP-binding protein
MDFNPLSISKSNWKIGYLPQQSSIQRDFPASVWEVVLSGCIKKNLFYTKDDKKMADMQIEKLGLSGIAKKSYRDLSGGQQQRVLLARALCAGKDLLVLDEPVTGLDPVVTDELYSTIRELNQKEKIAVIMVSHDVNRAVQNATHILHMDRKPLFFGTSADYEKTELYKTMTNVEVCETHLCHHCGTGCHASHV